MAGHNKWSKIKRKKGVADAKRSKIFSRLIKEITVAVREGGSPEPEFNPRLRLALQNAKGVNMPKDNVERAIKKATDSDTGSFLELNYEGYAPGGIAVFVECLSDNQNRTVSNVRSYFNKYGGNLATSGSVDFLFDRKGVFVLEKGDWDEEELTFELIDAGAEDIDFDETEVTITTSIADYGAMQKKLESLNIEPKNVELQRIPKTTTQVDADTAKKALRLIEIIEDDDDVQAVFHNMELTDEIMSVIEA